MSKEKAKLAALLIEQGYTKEAMAILEGSYDEYEGSEEIPLICHGIIKNLGESLQAYKTFKLKLTQTLGDMDTILDQYNFKDKEFTKYFKELSEIERMPKSKEIESLLTKVQQKANKIIKEMS